MTKLNEQSTITDIAAEYNRLKGADTDVKTLAKRGKAKLLAQISAMLEAQPAKAEPVAEVEQPVAEVEQPAGVLASLGTKAERPAEPVAKAKRAAKKAEGEKKEKGPVIRSVAEGLLLEVVTHDEEKRPFGHPYEYILDRIREQFDGAKTTVACLRWYAVHMRERGEHVPFRPRPRAVPIAKKAEA